MRKLSYNADTLVYEVVLLFLIVALFALCGDRSPERKLGLHIDTEFIGGCKCGVGRTASVETVVVYTIVFSDFQALFPLVHITRCITCERENKSVVLSSEERFTPVYKQFSVDIRECDKSECSVVNILAKL